MMKPKDKGQLSKACAYWHTLSIILKRKVPISSRRNPFLKDHAE